MAYTYSKLCTSTLPELAAKANDRGATIPVRFAIHHMASVTGALECARYHLNGPSASANYYVGKDGDICGGVPEELRAWTTGGSIDYSAITFEISNETTGGDWPIGAKTYAAFINLAAEIATRRGWDFPHYDGTKGGAIVYHSMFSATACPGPWLTNKIQSGQLEADIKAAMQALAQATPEASGTLYRVQVGAFKNKTYAENYLAKIQAAGFADAFIAESKQ